MKKEYEIGDKVELKNGRIGKIIDKNANFILAKEIKNGDNDTLSEGYIPIHHIKDYYFERGEEVEISDEEGYFNGRIRIFLTKIEGTAYPYICVNGYDEKEFKNNKEFRITTWKYIRPVREKKHTITLEDGTKISISEESYNELAKHAKGVK